MTNWLLYRGEKFNANFFYQSGVDVDHSFLLVSRERRVLLVPEMNRDYAESLFNGEVITYGKKALESISKILKKSETLGLDFRNLPTSFYTRISKTYKKTKDISEELAEERSLKGKKEVSKIKKAAKISRKIIDAAGEYPEPTEQETAKELLLSTYSADAEPAFRPIVSSGRNTSYPHSTPTFAKVSSPLLIDYGARLDHYNSDLTRCFFLSGEQLKIYNSLRRISSSILDQLPNLETGRDLAKLAKALYKKEGLQHPPHSMGHGIGLEVHE
ncbi:M24 family metallopeptidase, partial [Candidatus Micrarchaeota archaeon]|nr:M24 family metallopeptidase [Candidatus Micrarchaeota archaeon]MBD3417492.1 M24 family metallopeptidase [Candidatus Micrarchaeota archaeon]